jgi:hypothetical protein
LEEVLEAEQNCLHDQIADYEAWEEAKMHVQSNADSHSLPSV